MTEFLSEYTGHMKLRPDASSHLRGAILGKEGMTVKKTMKDTDTIIELVGTTTTVQIKGEYKNVQKAEEKIIKIIQENSFEVKIDKKYAKEYTRKSCKLLTSTQETHKGFNIKPCKDINDDFTLTFLTKPDQIKKNKETMFTGMADELIKELSESDETKQFRKVTQPKDVCPAKYIEEQVPPNPTCFFLQFETGMAVHEVEYVEEATDVNDKMRPLKKLSYRCGILAPYRGFLYRAEIREVYPFGFCDKNSIYIRVFFVDYGNEAIVDYFQCIELQRKHLYPKRAQKLKLEGIKEEGQWSQTTLAAFETLLKDKPLQVTFTDDDDQSNDYALCKLGSTRIEDIAIDLIDRGYGRHEYGPFESFIVNTEENAIGTCSAPFARGYDGGLGFISVTPSKKQSNEEKNFTINSLIGEQMEQSIGKAYRFSKAYLGKYEKFQNFYKDNTFHISHCGILTNADGPSFGVAIALAFISAVTKKIIPSNLCVTGEILLNGEIKAVGGIKEKIGALHNNFNIQKFYLPAANSTEAREEDLLKEREVELHDCNQMDHLIAEIFNGNLQ